MDLWHSLGGMVELEIVTADPSETLSALHRKNIPLEKVLFLDELTVHFHVQRHYARSVLHYAQSRGLKCRAMRNSGLFWYFHGLLKRPVLVAGLAFLLILTAFLPTRTFFFQVEGNVNIPENRILELAAQHGIAFGASRREVRSEKVKNALLGAIPELEWVGINTAGCVATISVRERQRGEAEEAAPGVSSIVAVRDGVVQELTVTGGSAACKPGQAVKAGQTLISGYTDCGLSIRAERAKGEVYATTSRHLSLIMPEHTQARGTGKVQNKKISLLIGKKRINFYQDSGILDTSCVKMYEEKYLTLPGGFSLPLAIVTETYIQYDENTLSATAAENGRYLTSFAETYLHGQMVAGKILGRQEAVSEEDGAIVLNGEYACVEMIGRERIEEIITP